MLQKQVMNFIRIWIDDVLTPIVTIILYYGEKPWNGPTSFQAMLGTILGSEYIIQKSSEQKGGIKMCTLFEKMERSRIVRRKGWKGKGDTGND